MKHTLTYSEESQATIRKLIEGKYYNGFVNEDGFVLIPNRFPNNHRLVGTKNEEKIDIRFDFKEPLNVLWKLATAIFLAISIFHLFKGGWFLLLIFFGIWLLLFIDFKRRAEKELDLFLIRYGKTKRELSNDF